MDRNRKIEEGWYCGRCGLWNDCLKTTPGGEQECIECGRRVNG